MYKTSRPHFGRPVRTTVKTPPAHPEPPLVSDCRQVQLTQERRLRTRVAGIFLFLPLLSQLRFDHLVRQPDYPGSRRVPAVSALLSLLALKLLDKKRHSHINDFNFAVLCVRQRGTSASVAVLPRAGGGLLGR